MITHHCAGCGKPDKTPDIYTPPGWVTVATFGKPDRYLCPGCYKGLQLLSEKRRRALSIRTV